MKTVRLKEGLGDCLLAGAAIQKYCQLRQEKVEFITAPKLEPAFRNHPDIIFNPENKIAEIELRWASQCRREKNLNVYSLHASNRYAVQLNILIDPTDTLNIYDDNKQIIKNNPTKKTVCINIFSKELYRRFIPFTYIDFIINICKSKGYEIIFMGDCGRYDGMQDIATNINVLKDTTLFIGPVSFMYHLASCLDVKCMTFFTYTPYWKFSDFKNTIPLYNLDYKCVFTCEEYEEQRTREMGCYRFNAPGICKITEYDYDLIELYLNRILK